MALKDLFKTKTDAPKAIEQSNTEDRRTGETYTAYGVRMCGRVNASPNALVPFIQKIYNQERQEQIKDQAQQQQQRQKLETDLINIDADIKNKQNNLSAEQQKLSDANDNVTNIKSEIQQLKASEGNINKSARTKMIVGVCILLPLTLYLFIFYSSTFYSAFFKDFSQSTDTGLKTAMFDSQALSHALDAGITELIFVLSAPIIFLGLGYCLHVFNEKKEKSKYLKVLGILSITFIFDCILAYLIAKSIYDVNALNSIEELPPYGLTDAIHDVNTWAVIFCGFIVYIIWGIVFDMAYTAYESLRSNKSEIATLQVHEQHFQDKINNINQNMANINNQIIQLENNKRTFQQRLNNNVFIDITKIKVALSDFFSGWTSVMPALGKSGDLQEAQDIYNKTIDSLTSNN